MSLPTERKVWADFAKMRMKEKKITNKGANQYALPPLGLGQKPPGTSLQQDIKEDPH